MKYDPDVHRRRSIRLKGFDYSTPGAYFVTINILGRECLLGEISDSTMYLNSFGQAVEEVWNNLPNHYPNLELDAFVVMPNHVHAIFILTTNVGPGLRPGLEVANINDADGEGRPTLRVGPTKNLKKRQPLTTMVGSLKSFSARRINQIRGLTGVPLWQEDYYEHIIRNEDELNAIREYIFNNPLGWDKDEENPAL